MHRISKLFAVTIVVLALAALVLVVVRSQAGPEKVAFPAGYKDGVLYTIADRYDIKQYRELYVSPAAAVQTAKEGKPLPHGTVLTLVQYKAQVDPQGNPLKDARGRFLKGQRASLTFPSEGVFSYNCALHPNMKGSVEVKK